MKYLVMWYDGDNNRVTLVTDGSNQFPFGVTPDMISDDCYHINAIVEVPDKFNATTWIADDREQGIEVLSI